MAKDHGPSVKNDKQYEGLRGEGDEQGPRRGDRQHPDARARAGRSPAVAAAAAAAARAAARSGGNRAQKRAAGRKGGKAAAKS